MKNYKLGKIYELMQEIKKLASNQYTEEEYNNRPYIDKVRAECIIVFWKTIDNLIDTLDYDEVTTDDMQSYELSRYEIGKLSNQFLLDTKNRYYYDFDTNDLCKINNPFE